MTKRSLRAFMALAALILAVRAGEAAPFSCAANLYYKGGEIEVPVPGGEDALWIYKGYSGRFVYSGGEAAFSVKKGGVLSVKTDGSYKAKKAGETVVTALPSGAAKNGGIRFIVRVTEEPKRFSLSPGSRTTTGPSQDARRPMRTTFQLKGVSINKKTPVDISIAEGTMEPVITRSGRKITLKTDRPGECTVRVEVAGAQRDFHWTMRGIEPEQRSILLSPTQKGEIKVSCASARRFRWNSSDSKVALVRPDGSVEGRKIGNAIITGVEKNKGYRVGCVVSVTSEANARAIMRGKEIAQGTYSLGRRMQKGYYDCSSLVWRAFVQEGINFGVPLGGYAPVAGTEAQYLERQGKILSTWKQKDMEKLKYLAGDMMFRTNTGNGHYRGINHVEIIAGYEVYQYDKKGKPIVRCVWVNRDPEYSYTINAWDIIGRP